MIETLLLLAFGVGVTATFISWVLSEFFDD